MSGAVRCLNHCSGSDPSSSVHSTIHRETGLLVEVSQFLPQFTDKTKGLRFNNRGDCKQLRNNNYVTIAQDICDVVDVTLYLLCLKIVNKYSSELQFRLKDHIGDDTATNVQQR